MIILVGASASGKTEIAKYLMKTFEIKKVVTHTTRAIRPTEIYDVDYHFVSKEEFEDLISNNLLVEHTFYNGNYYGCSKAEIADNKVAVLDPNGLESFQALCDPNIKSFYLSCDRDIREIRMTYRGDERQDIEKRLKLDDERFTNPQFKTDFQIDTSRKTISELAKEIYETYIKSISE